MKNELDFDQLANVTAFASDLSFSLNGMDADEYIAKVTDEINQIDLSSVPIDRWDILVTFMLAMLEVAGDFFIGDPEYKYSLANKNGPFCKWLKQFHKHRGGSPIDYQGAGFGGGDHRGKTFAHDAPLTRAIYGAERDENGEKSTTKRVYNFALWAHDLICSALAVYSIATGKFVDCSFTKDGTYKLIVENLNQKGNAYESCDVFTALVRYLVHMLTDFCSSRSLPIPGWSILTHMPNCDIEAFAMKLYSHGMNLRTMVLQGVPVAMTELLMTIYIWLRSKDSGSQYSESAWKHKKNKLLLIAHGITTAVNAGKVIVTEAPWRLNPVVIVRTFYLSWKVIDEETKLTNRHIEALDAGVLKTRIESARTLVLLDELVYEAENLDPLVRKLSSRIKDSCESRDAILRKLDSKMATVDRILEDE